MGRRKERGGRKKEKMGSERNYFVKIVVMNPVNGNLFLSKNGKISGKVRKLGRKEGKFEVHRFCSLTRLDVGPARGQARGLV